MKTKTCIIALVLAYVLFPVLPSLAATYTYDDLNRLIMVDYGNGQKINYTYDAGGNLLSVQSSSYQFPAEPVLSLDSTAYTLLVGETHQTTVSVTYADGSVYVVTDYARFTSSEPDVAAVNEAGLVTGVSKGQTVITATYGGLQAAAVVTVVEQSKSDAIAPVYQSASIDSTNKIVTLTFNENLISNKATPAELKSAVSFAADGINFVPLGPADTVAINGNTLVVTFNNPLTGNSNKIKVAAGTLKDAHGNVLDTDVITGSIVAHNLTQTATGSSGGGITPLSNQVEKPIHAGTTTIVEIPGKVKVEVPAGTVTGSKASVVVETMSDTKAGGAGMPLLSQVVGVKLKNGTMAGRIKITLHFDKNKLGKGQEPVAFYDAGGRWSRLEGNVDHDRGTVTLSVDHLTLFAVFAVTKETPKPVVTFNDIQSHWAETTINKLAGMGVVSGYPDGTFKPENTITRAEVTAILVRALKFKPGTNGLSQFADEANIPIWARQFVAAAVSEGLLKGYPHPDGTATFEADRPVSRAELAVMTAQIINNKFGKVNQSNIRFSDANNIPEWARGAVGTLVAKNIVSGYPDNTFRAENLVTRAEAALIIVRLLELK